MFVLPSMRGGGSERVISILLKYLDREKFDLSLVLLQKEGKYLADIPEDVKLYDLKSSKVRYSVFKLISLIRTTRPDIVFSTLGHMNLMLSLLRPWLSKKITFIARESNTVSIKNKYSSHPKIFDFLYKNFYDNFDLIVCQSLYMKNDLIKNYNVSYDKIHVINNPVEIEKINSMVNTDDMNPFSKQKMNLLSVGRLNRQKGYDLLIQALAKLEHIDFKMTILGEGPEKEKLQNMVNDYGLEKKIHFAGFKTNPYSYMKNADIFILSSRFEGFPNVVLETNACGTPVVAFNCPGGTNEIIQNGLNGFLCECENIESLAATIEKAAKYHFDKNAIISYIKQTYDVDIIIKQYEEVLS